MHNLVIMFTMISSVLAASLGVLTHCTSLILILLVMLFLLKNNSLINLMLLLEVMVLNILFYILLESHSINFNYWNIFSILVLSAVEASVGLSLVVSLTRIWGSSMKVSLFK